MTRPAGDAARRLLDAARRVARERGCGAIKVRETCRAAGVNPGLFHYHFRSREAFVRRVLDETYRDFFSRLAFSAGGHGTPTRRLRAALKEIALFARDHRRLFVGLLRDALNGDRLVLEFAAARFPRHLPIILGLYHDAVRSRQLRALPDPLALTLLMGTVSTPNVAAVLVEDAGARRPLGLSRERFNRELLSEAAIETRLDLLLKALAEPRGRR